MPLRPLLVCCAAGYSQYAAAAAAAAAAASSGAFAPHMSSSSAFSLFPPPPPPFPITSSALPFGGLGGGALGDSLLGTATHPALDSATGQLLPSPIPRLLF